MLTSLRGVGTLVVMERLAMLENASESLHLSIFYAHK